jgi:hypothetical protein
MLEEKIDELLSMIRVLDTKINFLQEDINIIKDDQLDKLRLCVEQLAREDLNSVAEKAKAQLKVERL